MGKTETCQCKYSSCLHESRDIDKNFAIKQGNAYYHEDCAKTKDEIKEIIELFKTHINKNPVYSQLQSVIKNIIFTKELGSSFLLFGLKYYIEHKIPLNYPQGLYYVIQNKDVIATYNKEKTKKIKRNIEITQESNLSFTHIPNKNSGFADILK